MNDLISYLKHPQKNIIINGRRVPIDKDIIPLVKYINKLDGAKTLWSCQGEESCFYDSGKTPYVMFESIKFEPVKIATQLVGPNWKDAMVIGNIKLDSYGSENVRCTIRLSRYEHIKVINNRIKNFNIILRKQGEIIFDKSTLF